MTNVPHRVIVVYEDEMVFATFLDPDKAESLVSARRAAGHHTESHVYVLQSLPDWDMIRRVTACNFRGSK